MYKTAFRSLWIYATEIEGWGNNKQREFIKIIQRIHNKKSPDQGSIYQDVPVFISVSFFFSLNESKDYIS